MIIFACKEDSAVGRADEPRPVGQWVNHIASPAHCPLYPMDLCTGWYEFALCLFGEGKRNSGEIWEKRWEKMRNREKQTSLLFGPREWLFELQEARLSGRDWMSCFPVRFRSQMLFFCASCGKMGHRIRRRPLSSFLAEDKIEGLKAMKSHFALWGL